MAESSSKAGLHVGTNADAGFCAVRKAVASIARTSALHSALQKDAEGSPVPNSADRNLSDGSLSDRGLSDRAHSARSLIERPQVDCSRAELVEFDDPGVARLLFGPNNANLELLAEASGAKIASRGLKILVDSEDPGRRQCLVSLFLQLYELFRQGVKVTQEDVLRSWEMVRNDPGVALAEVFREAVFVHTPQKTVTARNFAQKSYLDSLKQHSLVFAVGPAGTGKTYLAVAMALSLYAKHQVKRIILTRPAVEAGERLGFLPGDLAEKVNPYLRPLYDALNDMLPPAKVAGMLETGAIEVAPLAFMRGRTLNDAFIILDEAQNTTREQMKMFLTRMGFGSRMVVTGDVTQIDLPMLPGVDGPRSGLVQALKILSNVPGIAVHSFQKSDVVRHPLVGAIVEAYDRADPTSGQAVTSKPRG